MVRYASSGISAALLIYRCCYPIFQATRSEAHAYQISPVSRQYSRTKVFNDGKGEHIMEKYAGAYNGGGPAVVKERTIARMSREALDKYEARDRWPLTVAWELGERLPNGNYLETDEMGVGHGVCGDTPQSQDDNPNVYSTPNSGWPVLEEHVAGSIIEMKVVILAYHWGHLEFFLCDTADMDDPDGVVTQECLNKYPLTRAPDDSFNSPVDPDYPGRYYIDPECRGETGETDQTRPLADDPGFLHKGQINHMRYQLPDITCERCVLQMRYHSGIGCFSPGYEEYNPSSWPSKCAPRKEDWILFDTPDCGQPGKKYGNLWFGCSDISLVSGSRSGRARVPAVNTNDEDDEGDDNYDGEYDDDNFRGDGYAAGERYVGCYADEENEGRIMDHMHLSPGDVGMTTELCALKCKGYDFFGTQFGRECWCGNGGSGHLRHGESEECDTPCEGDGNQICGGQWSMSVYEN